jgi:hypothetical protein
MYSYLRSLVAYHGKGASNGFTKVLQHSAMRDRDIHEDKDKEA